ncbi:hypothetical protein GQ55_9G217300 [Panicum hallii var. hallii]|uniref:Uncharacterized protein n=1 Tax=Panicum hallii var. hallii TaxID=1504633 RepID=A0A2T7C5T3_9POAL|nr:hypothetical protein GQ55_9G217300 [Panicum hallii var. hallii]
MIARHGEGYDWRNAPIDPEAVYSSGGKPHGRYLLFEKVIDSSQVPSRQRAGSSRSASRSTSSGDDSAEVVRLRERLRQQELQQQWFQAQLAQQNAILQQIASQRNIQVPPLVPPPFAQAGWPSASPQPFHTPPPNLAAPGDSHVHPTSNWADQFIGSGGSVQPGDGGDQT